MSSNDIVTRLQRLWEPFTRPEQEKSLDVVLVENLLNEIRPERRRLLSSMVPPNVMKLVAMRVKQIVDSRDASSVPPASPYRD